MKKTIFLPALMFVLLGAFSAVSLQADDVDFDHYHSRGGRQLHDTEYNRPHDSSPRGFHATGTPSPVPPSGNFFNEVFSGGPSPSGPSGGGGGLGSHSMPEPSALPELAAGVAGLAFVALRRRKKAVN